MLSDVNAKTEETFQSLQEKYLSNEEYTVIRNKRSMKDEGYLEIFRLAISRGPASFSIDQVMQSLKEFAQQSMREEQQWSDLPPAQSNSRAAGKNAEQLE